jgi:hypothetical protein
MKSKNKLQWQNVVLFNLKACRHVSTMSYKGKNKNLFRNFESISRTVQPNGKESNSSAPVLQQLDHH